MSGEPPRASSYSREILQRLRRSCWKKRYVLGAVFLGQILSLCLCGTGVTSQLLVADHNISVPTTQCFLNYLLLGLTFGVHFATKKRFMRVLKYNWWKYLILGVVDVEANFLIILAYRYTNLTSIQLLDCFTIVAVMVLSYVFLKTRYKLINIMGVLLTVIGIACLVFADLNSARNKGGSAMFVGDMLCLVAAVLYAAGNVTQEYLVKSHSILEYLGLIGVVGSFVSGAQLIALERMDIAKIQWSPSVGGLFSGFGVSLFLFYSLTPWVIRMSSAVVFNLSLLTADFYSLIFGLFLFHYKTPALRAVGNIVTGSDHQTQLVLDCGALSYFDNLFRNARSNIQKEAAWTISNITAGQPSQIQAVIDMQLVPHLIQIMIKGEYKAQKEAVWAITNLTAGGNPDQVVYILQANGLKPLCDLLVVKDAKIVQVLLDAILNILNVASKREVLEQVCMMIEECEGLDKIEALQQHSNEDVYKLSLSIIDKYFSEEEEDQSLAPVASSSGFQFAPAAVQSVPSGGFSF